MINRKATYDNIRKSFGKLSVSQVEGFEAVFNEFEKQKLADSRYLAYILATIWHEVNKTMQPIEEYGKGKGRRYGQRFRYNGEKYTNTLNLFYGRGHTQNTWIDIYEKLTEAAKKQGYDWDFVNHPELLLQMEPSIWATFYAMQAGLYTGRKLSQYFNTTTNDPINARKIINGTDKAVLIAGYYEKFLQSIQRTN
jgi:putative chitinase